MTTVNIFTAEMEYDEEDPAGYNAAVSNVGKQAGGDEVSNAKEHTARVLMFSSGREPAVSVYPDSDKIGVWTGNPDDKLMLKRADGQVAYWEGEE